MIGVSERRSAEFLEWEARGRGFAIWPHPVGLEPPFKHLRRRAHSAASEVDDGRKPTLLSSFVQKLSERLAPIARAQEEEEEDEDAPEELTRGEISEIQAYLPAGLKHDTERYRSLFVSLSVCAA